MRGHGLQQRVLRRRQQLRRLHPGLPRGAAAAGAAGRHLVPRSERKARPGSRRRSTASTASTPISPTTPSCARTSRGGSMNSKVGRWTLAVLAHLALLAAWYLFVRYGNVPKFVMPSPAATLDALLEPNYNWWTNIAVTGTEIFGGYLLALAVGVALALCSPGRRRSKRSSCRFSRSTWCPRSRSVRSSSCGSSTAYSELDHGVLDRGVPDPPHHRARPARDRAGAPRPRALAQRLALAALHQDPASRRAALHLFRHEGRRDPRRRRRDRRRVPRLGQGLGYLMLQVQVTLDTPAMFMAVLLITLLGMLLYASCSFSSACSS